MQCATMCEMQGESLDPFSTPSTHRSVLCKRPRRDCFRAGTNGRVTEAQQHGRIGGEAWARDGLSSQRAWVLGCWGGRRLGGGLLPVCLPASLPSRRIWFPWRSQPCMGLNSASWESPRAQGSANISPQAKGWNQELIGKHLPCFVIGYITIKANQTCLQFKGGEKSPRESSFSCLCVCICIVWQSTDCSSLKITNLIPQESENQTLLPVSKLASTLLEEDWKVNPQGICFVFNSFLSCGKIHT